MYNHTYYNADENYRARFLRCMKAFVAWFVDPVSRLRP